MGSKRVGHGWATELNWGTKILEAAQHCQKKKKKDLVCSECVHGVFPRPHSLNRFMPALCLEENLPVINGNRWFSYQLVNSFANWPIFWDSQGHNLAVSHLSTSSDFSVTKPCFKPGCPDRKPEKGNTPSSCRYVLYGSVEATTVQWLLAATFSLWCSWSSAWLGFSLRISQGRWISRCHSWGCCACVIHVALQSLWCLLLCVPSTFSSTH